MLRDASDKERLMRGHVSLFNLLLWSDVEGGYLCFWHQLGFQFMRNTCLEVRIKIAGHVYVLSFTTRHPGRSMGKSWYHACKLDMRTVNNNCHEGAYAHIKMCIRM